MSLLEYEAQMLKEASDDDNLMIFSSGLSMYRILIELFKHYIKNENFVIVTGIDSPEDLLLINKFKHTFSDQDDEFLESIRIIDSDCSMSERRKIYSKPKVLFVSGRILVVDLLANRIPVTQINGLIVLNAQKVSENCLEAFICRLFRSKNRVGFIKGFSEKPNYFTGEINKLDRIMRFMFIKKLSLWPRFHMLVNETFQKRASPEVIELRLPLTENMKKIQYSIIQLINNCLKEVARTNLPSLVDFENLTAENIICLNLNQYYARHFFSIWNQLSPKTKRLLEDIKLLKRLLFSLTSDDCVTFYQVVKSVRDNIKINSNVSDWIFWEPTEVLFVAAKDRLELPPRTLDTDEVVEIDKTKNNDNLPDNLITIENNQKWDSFYETILEIKSNLEYSEEPVTIFVLVEFDRTIDKLEKILDQGSRNVLKEMNDRKKLTFNELIEEMKIETELQNLEQNTKEDNLTNLNLSISTQKVKLKDEAGIEQEVELNTIFHSFKDGPLVFENMLYSYKPKYTIFYDYNISCIRLLEVYQAAVCSPNKCFIYLLIFDGSAEEQKYFSNLRSEKESFERLINEKRNMVIPVERDGKNGLNLDLIRGDSEFENIEEQSQRDQVKNMNSLQKNKDLYFCNDCLEETELEDFPVSSQESNSEEITNKLCAGCHRLNRNQVIRQKVIVDMREFRSVLPSIIHKRGIDIVPATITIGDYILTPDICVERKSISDLTQSLQSGRLYTQAKKMIRHYAKAFLLIEFDQKRSFSMKGKYWSTDRNDSSIFSEYNILSKLILLTIHFPRLKLIWSPTPEFSGEIFEDLKKGKDQPTLKKASSIEEKELDPQFLEDRYDLDLKDFLLNLPGINLSNVHRLMNNVKNLLELIKKSKVELIKLLDSELNGTKLYESLHTNKFNPYMNRTDVIRPKKVFKKI